MKALLVEDTLTSATLICQMLERIGLETVHVANGEAGVAMFKREKPDLVLLDIVMPGMDGYEVARNIRESQSRDDWTPIIFLSAQAGDECLVKGIDAGGDDYLVKPVSEKVLQAKVRAQLRMIQMRHQLVRMSQKLNEANQALTRLAGIDGLCGIANRRVFDESLGREWRRARRNGGPLSVIVLDVDHFKLFNDEYGHLAGDACLKRVAKALEGCLNRPNDLVARYGGEEFAAVLPETGMDGAEQVADAMRRAVASLAISHRVSPTAQHVTISLGVASCEPAQVSRMTEESFLRQADVALYSAKREGRNRAVCAGIEAEERK